MSYISPQVYHYSAKPYISAIAGPNLKPQPSEPFGTSVPAYQSAPRGMEHFGESQVNNIFRPANYPTPHTNFYPNQNPPSQNYQQYPAELGRSPSQQGHQLTVRPVDKYDQYLQRGRQQEYKYNLFSALDEPWNRCIGGQQCSPFPSNQCIASSNYRKYWK